MQYIILAIGIVTLGLFAPVIAIAGWLDISFLMALFTWLGVPTALGFLLQLFRK